ncbi:MAG: hypothetical protein LBH96_05560 [Candidatus Peribacteria bacterium]|nr:hypothetical protein [Candidatus Peribacteria bacterium]
MMVLERYVILIPNFLPMQEPLAFYLRPTSLNQMVGQEQIRVTIQSFLSKGQVPSMIFR